MTARPGELEQELELQIVRTLIHVVVVPLNQCPEPNYNRLWALDDWNHHIYRAALSCPWRDRENACDVHDRVSRHNKEESESTWKVLTRKECSKGCWYRLWSKTEMEDESVA